jgi:phytoene dehydrogenase-like protein
MVKKSVIIIGAGLAGLATGCYGQMNGFQTKIFEHNSKSGGVAAHWNRSGYLIDGGIHFVMQSTPNTVIDKLYREIGVDNMKLVPLTCIGKVVDEATGRSIEVTQDLDQVALDLKAISDMDAKTIDWLINGAKEMQGKNLLSLGFGSTKELMGRLDTLKMGWELRGFLKFMMGKNNQSVEDFCKKAHIHDPWLARILQSLFLPQVPVWFIKMYLALLADGMLWLLENGCKEFVSLINKRYVNLGGEVNYQTLVDEVIVEKNQSVGIRLIDGTEHFADYVVSAADYYHTIYHLLRGKYTSPKIEARFDNWPLIDPIIQISFGVKRKFPDDPWIVMYHLEEPFPIGSAMKDAFHVRICNYTPHFAPEGRTLIQPMFETKWEYWSKLRKDKKMYNAEKQRIAEECLQRLECHYPGITGQVEMTDIATPYTYWRYTRNYQGSYMGWLPTPKILSQLIERIPPGLSHFYLAGQWVTPGGSVPASMITGRNAIEIICKREKQDFITTKT